MARNKPLYVYIYKSKVTKGWLVTDPTGIVYPRRNLRGNYPKASWQQCVDYLTGRGVW